MARKRTSELSTDRVRELAHDLADDAIELGPLDIEDIQRALAELLELRARYAYEQGEDVPTLRAAS